MNYFVWSVCINNCIMHTALRKPREGWETAICDWQVELLRQSHGKYQQVSEKWSVSGLCVWQHLWDGDGCGGVNPQQTTYATDRSCFGVGTSHVSVTHNTVMSKGLYCGLWSQTIKHCMMGNGDSYKLATQLSYWGCHTCRTTCSVCMQTAISCMSGTLHSLHDHLLRLE
jgi:hypothetical protein